MHALKHTALGVTTCTETVGQQCCDLNGFSRKFSVLIVSEGELKGNLKSRE